MAHKHTNPAVVAAAQAAYEAEARSLCERLHNVPDLLEFARLSGIGYSTLQNYRHRRLNPQWQNVFILKAALEHVNL